MQLLVALIFFSYTIYLFADSIVNNSEHFSLRNSTCITLMINMSSEKTFSMVALVPGYPNPPTPYEEGKPTNYTSYVTPLVVKVSP